MLLSGLEIPPLFATLAVLLDNCSSLFDCWDTLGAAAAAAVGAGAAAVFVGGLLLSPGEAPGIVEEGAPPQVAGSVSGPQPTFPGGAPTTVAQAPPQAAPTGVQFQAPPQVAPQASPQAPPQATAPTAPTAPTTPTAPQGTPVFGGEVQPGAIAASAPASPGAPAPAFEAPPIEAPPTAPAAPPAAPPTSPPVAPPVAPLVADTALAAGLAAGVAPVVSTLKAVLGSRAGGSGAGSDAASQDEGDQDDLDTCPEADASLFGLPDINTRQDCPGTRPGMPPNYAGLDFTSNDDHGRPLELPFEAGVTGEVTYVGGAFNSVQVTLDNGNRIQFLHASQVLVQLGQQVEPTTVLGRTGGTGPYGPNQYEIHLHVQAFDRHGDLIDPDCALSGGENRRLRRNVVPPATQATQATSAPPEAPREAFPTPGATAVLSGTQPLPYAPQVPVEPPPPQVPIQAAPPQAPIGLLCTRCGNTSPANARFCPYCGQTFAQAVAPAPPPVAPPAPPQTIYCGNCGQANAWGSVYCGRCGARLSY